MGIFSFFMKKEEAVVEENSPGFTQEMIDAVFAELEKEKKPVIHMTVGEGETTCLDSRFGGLPYLPKGGELPRDEKGNLLFLLAQINLSQLPFGYFPLTQGMLQFWIGNDNSYGLDFENGISQKNSRVVYYKELGEYQGETELEQQYPMLFEEKEDTPLDFCFSLRFEGTEESLTSIDFQFDERFTEIWNKKFPQNPIKDSYALPDDFMEDPYNDHSGFGHKLLGYPAFTQTDPRDQKTFGDYILLFQMDSVGTKNHEIMWGDGGICGFFVKEDDLKKGEFSQVLYNWDCY